MSFAEIKQAYPQILTLDDFLDIAIDHKKSVLIETKHPVISGNRVEEIVVEKINEREIQKAIEVSVMSFSWSAIEKMKRLDGSIPTTFLMHQKTPFTLARLSSAPAIGPGIDLLRDKPELASKIKQTGRSLSVWTVDRAEDVELCKDLGVDNLITNMPAHSRTFL
jgi:glycerophosphoryl diester phosphodiesterase